MTLHVDEQDSSTTEHTIPTGSDMRLVVSRWDTPRGRSLVSLAPEYRTRAGEWRLAHSAVSFAPSDAQEIAAAVLAIAAGIEAQPPEPQPTAADREESRWP